MAAGPVGRARAALLAGLVGAVVLSCGKKGPPRPPEPRGPLPPGQVDVRQIGTSVRVSFVMPQPRGTRPSQVPERVELVRVDYPPGPPPPPDPDAFRRRGEVVAVEPAGSRPAGTRVALEDRRQPPPVPGRVGWTLRYGVRVFDRSGRVSPLVVARDLAPVETPPPPSGLVAEATADGIRLRWNGPDAAGEAKFNLYRTGAGEPFPERPLHREPLSTAAYLDESAEPGGEYVYVVRVSALDGIPFRESDSSQPVRVVAEDRFPPSPPERLVAVQEGAAVRLFWNPGKERDLAGYRVYRRTGEGEWARIGDELLDRPSFLDQDVSAGAVFVYRVTALDRAHPPNESSPSDEVEAEVGHDPTAGGGGP